MHQDGKVHIQRHVALQSGHLMPLRCAVSIRYEQYDPTSLEVELIYLGDEEERAAAYQATRAIDRNLMRLHAVDDGEDSINLLGLNGWTGNALTLRLEVGAIEVGIDRAAASRPINVHFTVGLQPSGILAGFGSSRRHYDGNIEMERDQGSILVETPVGTIEALEAYDYLDRTAFGDKVLHQVQRARLMGKTQLREGQTLRSFHDDLLEEVFTICKALSLCYRQQVDAYEIQYLCDDSEAEPYRRALYRSKWSSTRARHRSEELIHSSNLQEGGLSTLVLALKSHAEFMPIRRAIGFLSASHEGFLETAYFMAFSAMETIVNAVSEKNIYSLITSSGWKKVQCELQASIAALEDNGVVSSDVARHMREKLPELRRISLTSKIALVARAYSIKISDLWTAEGFEEGMREAAKLRNGLFHAAHSSDVGLMEVNLVRIQAFTERLLLAALSWPDDRRWARCDDQLHRIIQPRDPEAVGDH